MVSKMKLSTNTQCVKYLMFIFNLLFVITGIILLSIGAVIHAVYHNYQHFLDNKFFSAPNLLIAIGTIIFFVAFFGCCGAVRENYCMIVTFTCLLVLIFIMELAGGISGYVLRARATDIIEDKMNSSMAEYVTSEEVKLMWNKMQTDFHCCGTRKFSDWNKYRNGTLPDSCCQTGDTCTSTSETLYKEGCLLKMLHYVKSHAIQLGGVGIGIAFVQAIGVWFSIFLARSIRNSYENV